MCSWLPWHPILIYLHKLFVCPYTHTLAYHHGYWVLRNCERSCRPPASELYTLYVHFNKNAMLKISVVSARLSWGSKNYHICPYNRHTCTCTKWAIILCVSTCITCTLWFFHSVCYFTFEQWLNIHVRCSCTLLNSQIKLIIPMCTYMYITSIVFFPKSFVSLYYI